MIIGLRGVVVRQASVYLGKFHQGRVEKCARVVLDELWNQVEVGPDLQGVVDVLVKCAVKDAHELNVDAEGAVFGRPNPGGAVNGVGVNGRENVVSSPSSPTSQSKSSKLRSLPPMKTYAELSETESVPASNSKESTKSSGSAKGSTKHLKIEDRSYYIVSATAEILVLLIDYLRIVINLRYGMSFRIDAFVRLTRSFS
jgi:vacuolar protein sorting-associated protein 54